MVFHLRPTIHRRYCCSKLWLHWGRKVKRDSSLRRITHPGRGRSTPDECNLNATQLALEVRRGAGTAASASTGPKALAPGVGPWGSGPGQPTFSVTRRCVSGRNASPPRLHAASCLRGAHGGLQRSLSKVFLDLVGRGVIRLESRDTFLPHVIGWQLPSIIQRL